MRVDIITIGDELLLGFTVDTNAAHLSRVLASAGIEVTRRATVGDVAADIVDEVRAGLDRAGAVITTGGLGPTSDDLTKPALATLFGRDMVFDAQVYEGIAALFRSRGLSGPLPEANRQQAMVPRGASILTNRHGTAPGIWLEDDRARWVAMLPGVPREMRGMLADELMPRLLARRPPGSGSVLRSIAVRTTGIAESALADKLQGIDLPSGVRPLAYLPGLDGVDLRVTVLADTDDHATSLLEASASVLATRVGAVAYGRDDEDLAAIVLSTCRRRALRAAVAESCTGGLLAARLTAIPGSSDVIAGGIVAYSNDVKITLLDVPAADIARDGAVSETVARRMAAGVRARMGTPIGVGITGIAGPDGGTPDKPVGTVWVAVDVDGAVDARMRRFPGTRDEVRYRSAQMALDMLRRALAPRPES
jgi:nicotinamide-nucleotide amidase